MTYANKNDAEQPAHLHSLTSIFVIRCLDSIIPLRAIAEISRLQLVSVTKQVLDKNLEHRFSCDKAHIINKKNRICCGFSSEFALPGDYWKNPKYSDAWNICCKDPKIRRWLYHRVIEIMRKPVYAICEQQRRILACTSAQSDLHLCCSLPR